MVYWSLHDLTGTIGGVDMDSQATTLVGLIGPRRKALRLSMQKAADIAGVHRLTWSAWEKGKARPEEYNYAGIDAALQLQPGTIGDVVAGRPFNVPGPQPPREVQGRAPWQTYRVTAAEALNLLQVAMDEYGAGGFWKAFDEIYFGREDTQRTSHESPSDQQGQPA